MTQFGINSWGFPPLEGASVPRTVQFSPRMVVNSVRGAIASTVAGHGVTRLLSYHIAEEVRAGDLQLVLTNDEHRPYPVHLISPQGRLSVPKVRAFVDFAASRLLARFAALAQRACKGLLACKRLLAFNERASAATLSR